MKTKPNLYALLAAACLACLAAGCVTTTLPKPEMTVQSPKVDMSSMKRFYVARNTESGAQGDKHVLGLHAVQQALVDHGMPATSGLLSAMPPDTDCKVIIHDHFFWDVNWYLLSLDIKFYDARSGALIASGFCRRAHPSIRRPPEFVANEIIEALFPSAGGTKNQ